MITFFIVSLKKLKNFEMEDIDFSEAGYDPDLNRESGLLTDE